VDSLSGESSRGDIGKVGTVARSERMIDEGIAASCTRPCAIVRDFCSISSRAASESYGALKLAVFGRHDPRRSILFEQAVRFNPPLVAHKAIEGIY
jgi:hypothetical protein